MIRLSIAYLLRLLVKIHPLLILSLLERLVQRPLNILSALHDLNPILQLLEHDLANRYRKRADLWLTHALAYLIVHVAGERGAVEGLFWEFRLELDACVDVWIRSGLFGLGFDVGDGL